ncbi:hypothetical protein EUGRSUZ_D01846 [Eucalyptus grandis]|uniref:Uncharacterized protein n=1 Tax=Eucalyptus grandis TaxID=71139 RepID=A0A059CH12_EUCGR|nr:hypothetical protein EUGRSUZ_D01846 [Eucalyptus grandis]
MARKRGSGRRPAADHTAARRGGGGGGSITLRQETAGLKPPGKGGAPANPKSVLKLQHLRRLAEWTGREGSVPSLSAFFGRRLASAGESLGVPPDPSLVSCQRCETVLQPGYNCTIRIEKSRAKTRRRQRKPVTLTQNNVVYMCHFCSHRNLKRGTAKGHMKELYPVEAKSISKPVKSAPPVSYGQGMGSGRGDETKEESQMSSPAVKVETLAKVSPSTPLTKTLLDGKRQKRSRSGAKRPTQPESADAEATAGASSKRRKKSWMSLKEIAESSEHGASRNIASLKIPFCI